MFALNVVTVLVLINLSTAVDVSSNGEFGKEYFITINASSTITLHYEFNSSSNYTTDFMISLFTRLADAVSNFNGDVGIQITARQLKYVTSWALPQTGSQGVQETEITKFICPEQDGEFSNETLVIQISTYSLRNISLHMQATKLSNFTVSIGQTYNIDVYSSSPQFYQFIFDNSIQKDYVTLYASSEQDICSYVSVRKPTCVNMEIPSSFMEAGDPYQTFLRQSSLVIQKPLANPNVYIMFAAAFSELTCNKRVMIYPSNYTKVKHISFRIEEEISDSDYAKAISAALGYCISICLVCVVVVWISHCGKDKGCPPGSDGSDNEITPISQVYRQDYGTSGIAASHPLEECHSPDTVSLDADLLEDIDHHKEVYRQKISLMVSDMSRKGDSPLNKKYRLYLWNGIIVSIFYVLPVVQLVLAYQQYLNLSGDQDICYYNFRCSRPLGLLHNFNNIFSNIGYFFLGIAFLVVTYQRKKKHEELHSETSETLGIPAHFGLYYAMGWALVVEGILSACYHVCPNNTNFQFDTAFMYILGGLQVLRLFQSRHADINVNAHTAYFSFATIVFVAVVGVVYNHTAFWALFTVLYLLLSLYLSLQLYYMGHFRIGAALFNSVKLYLRSDCGKCMKPLYVSRLVILVLMNAVNWVIAIVGTVMRPSDFASYLLSVVIANLLLYTAFYGLMKLINKEKISIHCLLYGGLATLLWIGALYFFLNNQTSWQLTPAQSRDLNEPCVLLNFFDYHDIWHFLSASAMFCSFLVIFHLDDDLIKIPRDRIPVF